jgi:hypothetical protein
MQDFYIFLTKKGFLLSKLYMEDDNNLFPNGRRPQYFWQTEDDLNILANGRQPQHFCQ